MGDFVSPFLESWDAAANGRAGGSSLLQGYETRNPGSMIEYNAHAAGAAAAAREIFASTPPLSPNAINSPSFGGTTEYNQEFSTRPMRIPYGELIYTGIAATLLVLKFL